MSQHELAVSALRSESEAALAALRAEHEETVGASAAAMAAVEESQRSALAGWVARQAVNRAELYEKNAGECERLRSLVTRTEAEMARTIREHDAAKSAAADARARVESGHQVVVSEIVARETELRSCLAAT